MSGNDSLEKTQVKMQEYRDNVRLSWLIDPKTSKLRFIVKIDQGSTPVPATLSVKTRCQDLLLDFGVGLKIKVRADRECAVSANALLLPRRRAMMALPLMVGLWWQVASG